MLPELEGCILDHVAVAVEDLEKSVEIYTKIGLNFSAEREVVEAQKVKTAFAAIDANAHLELLQATSEESAIHKFINKNGAGIHHLCFRVKDIDEKQKELIASGFKFIYPAATQGAGGCLVNFIHPKTTGGVLIEISQKIN